MNIARETTLGQGWQPADTRRQAAILLGIMFIIATVTAILGLLMYQPILAGPDYLMNGAGQKNQVILGALMELILACTVLAGWLIVKGFNPSAIAAKSTQSAAKQVLIAPSSAAQICTATRKNREDTELKVEARKMTRYWKTIRILIATIAVALALGLPAASPAQAAGLPNCVDLVGSGACYELVWVNGAQVRMVFPQAGQPYPGVTPEDKVDNFYVMAPQTGTAQGTLPFLHDHVVVDRPSRSHGAYSGIVHGFFVLCSEQGITSGACVPYMAVVEGLGTLPLAKTVNGQALTSVEPIEAAANAAFITLFDTGATFLGVIKPSN